MAIDATNLLSRDTFVINQKAKLFELRNEFRVLDEAGEPIGTVRQDKPSIIARMLRVLTSLDVLLPMTLVFKDLSGQPALIMHKPWFGWACDISLGSGQPMGSIRKQLRLGKGRFDVKDASGETIGEVHALNWRAKDFSIRDANDMEVARVTKKWAGFAREMFTDADHYIVQVQPGLPHPLRALSVGAALAIDTIMKNKDAGGGGLDDFFS